MFERLTTEESKANLSAMRADLFGTVYSAIKSGNMAVMYDCYAWIEGGGFDRHHDADMAFGMLEPIVEADW